MISFDGGTPESNVMSGNAQFLELATDAKVAVVDEAQKVVGVVSGRRIMP